MRRVRALLLALCLALAGSLGVTGTARAAAQTVTNGVQFTDTSGNALHAHGGGVIKVGSYYYWFGEDRNADNTFRYVDAYRSTDLKSWEFRGHVLSQSSASELGTAYIERPKVIYNAATGQYVMWMHKENGVDYSQARAAVAVSGTVDGSYTYQGSFQPLGGAAAASTSVSGETRRSLLPETATAAGETVLRSFTVNVRTPEGEPTGPDGTPGLDLVLGGSAPALAGITVSPARHARQILLIGDSTVCDQPADPYSGWGQQLPQFLRRGLSVANYADSGESTVSYLADPRLWATVQPLIRPGDLVLIQLAHNDKTTDEATYRANLETLVAGVRKRGGRPVLVTPIVRRWFSADGTLDNGTALLVNGLGVDLPAVIRSVAAAEDVPLVDLTARTKSLVESLGVEGSKALYLSAQKRDNTHTSVYGATVYAGLVRDALVALQLVGERGTRGEQRPSGPMADRPMDGWVAP